MLKMLELPVLLSGQYTGAKARNIGHSAKDLLIVSEKKVSFIYVIWFRVI